MTQILFIGQTVETVDFSDPALPPGLTVEKIQAGIAIAMASMADRGWQADLFWSLPTKPPVRCWTNS